MNTKTIEKITSDYVARSQKAKYDNMLASCSTQEQELIKMLEKIDIASGGQLNRLVAVYNAIKQFS